MQISSKHQVILQVHGLLHILIPFALFLVGACQRNAAEAYVCTGAQVLEGVCRRF